MDKKALVKKMGGGRYKVGDVVYPNTGAGKHAPHTVIHVHDDGDYNITPAGSRSAYRHGAARAKHEQLGKAPPKGSLHYPQYEYHKKKGLSIVDGSKLKK